MTDPIDSLERHRQLADALMDPNAYPWPVTTVRRIETHISTVLLAGEYAVKLKKPLDLGFLDFSSVARRRHFCEEEVRLNARLSPQIYLRRVEIVGELDAPRVDGDGALLEHAVLMHRFPEDELMNRLLREGRLPELAVERLAERVAVFHSSIPAAPADSTYGMPDQVLAPVEQNFQQLAELAAADSLRVELSRLKRWSLRQWEQLVPVFSQRREIGAVRECHGDLHLGNVAWHEDEVIVFDGIEFDPALRWIDTANEIAFTVMDLDFQGTRRLHYRFLDAYLQRTGDYGALRLLPFYLVYRALVRAKINGFEVDQGGGPAAREALHDHVHLALRYTDQQLPELVLTYGLSGSGKSTRARRLVEERGFVRLRSDVERKRLVGLDAQARSGSALDAGLYSLEASNRTYRHLLEQARKALTAGFSVAVDAAFLEADRRRPFMELAEELGCRFRILHVSASEETLRRRLRKRLAEGRDPSEADEAVLDRQLRSAQPPSGDEQPFVETVDAEE